jgi:hypothetical protein
MLITTWFPDPYRPTRDLDLLGFGDSAEESILSVFREVCRMPADDGITFEVNSLRIERVREELEYGGLRLRTVANLSRARINVVIEVGFGDAVEPGLEVATPGLARRRDGPDLWSHSSHLWQLSVPHERLGRSTGLGLRTPIQRHVYACAAD